MEKRSTGTDVNQVQITSLHHIQGQKQVIENLEMNLRAYFNTKSSSKREVSFGPVALCGPIRRRRITASGQPVFFTTLGRTSQRHARPVPISRRKH